MTAWDLLHEEPVYRPDPADQLEDTRDVSLDEYHAWLAERESDRLVELTAGSALCERCGDRPAAVAIASEWVCPACDDGGAA